MTEKTTYTVKLRTERNLETKADNMKEIVQRAYEVLKEVPCDVNEEYYEIEVIDNLTELTVFKERRVK